MAYTLTDQFRPLRLAMRLNGVVIGLGLGLLLLLTPHTTLITWGIFTGPVFWPLRMAGGVLIGLGVLFVLSASQEINNPPLLLTMLIVNTLLAVVLLIAYLQQEFTHLTLGGRFLLILIFVFCLAGALAPLRYLRTE